MLNYKKIFVRTQQRVKPKYQWLIAVYTFVHVLILNHCSAVLGLHLDLLENQDAAGFSPNLLQVNITSKLLTCREIARIQQKEPIGKGTTKEVFGGTYRGENVAVKMVTPNVKDVKLCLTRRASQDHDECYKYANYKLVKEIAYSLQLNSDRLLKLIGYCVRGDAVTASVRDQGVISVVEVGQKLSEYRIKHSTWPEKLQIGQDIAELLVFLENSPLGSLEIGDFKLSQFMLVDGRLKIGDLDDMSSAERGCEKPRDCRILGENAGIECVNGTCVGINERANILLATVEILEPLFQNPPEGISGRINLLLKKLGHYEMDANELQQSLTALSEAYSLL